MGKGEGCCEKEDKPLEDSDNKDAWQIAEPGTTPPKWVTCTKVKVVKATGCCAGDNTYDVTWNPSEEGRAAAAKRKEEGREAEPLGEKKGVKRVELKRLETIIPIDPDTGKLNFSLKWKNGKMVGRGCTDWCCIWLLFAFILCWIVIAVVAFQKGKPARLLMPSDFRDELCGDENAREPYPSWYVPLPEYKMWYGVCCTKDCPELGSVVCNNDWEFQSNVQADIERGVADWPGQPSWGRNNKDFQMTALEVQEANIMLGTPTVISANASQGFSGSVLTVMSRWPKGPDPTGLATSNLGVLDPMGYTTNCDFRDDFAAMKAQADGGDYAKKLQVQSIMTMGSAQYIRPDGAWTPWTAPCNDGERILAKKILEVSTMIDSYNCFTATYRSSPVVNRCIPVVDDEQNGESLNKLADLATASTAGQYVSDGFGEVEQAWRVIVITSFTAVLIAFLWLFLMRFILAPIIYTILLIILLALVGAGLACHYYALRLEGTNFPGDTTNDKQVMTFRVLSYLFWAGSIVYFILMCWLISRIRIAIVVLQQSSKVMAASPSMLIIPPLVFIFLVIFFGWFLLLAMWIQTSKGVSVSDFTGYTDALMNQTTSSINAAADATGVDPNEVANFISQAANQTAATVGNAVNAALPPMDMSMLQTNLSSSSAFSGLQINTSGITNGTLGETQSEDEMIIKYMQLVNLLGFLWMANYSIAIGYFTIAGVAVMWFWSQPTSFKKTAPPLAFRKSLFWAFRHHAGTLIFGSLLIAIIQLIRIIMMYIERQLPEEVKKSPQGKLIICLIHCFLAYLERIVKIINKNAYIYCAISGKNFCVSAKNALKLLIANVARVAVLAGMSEITMLLLKMLICGANVYVAMLLLDQESLTGDKPIESGLFPLFLILIETFIIACVVMSCFETCVDTVFLATLIDEEFAGNNKGGNIKVYTPLELTKLMDNFGHLGDLEAQYQAERTAALKRAKEKKEEEKEPPKEESGLKDSASPAQQVNVAEKEKSAEPSEPPKPKEGFETGEA